MKNQTSFRHPVNLRYDDRIASLINMHGPTGYGVYWMIIEMLHREELFRIKHVSKRIERMAALVGMDLLKFRELLHDLIHFYDLLVVEDGYLTSAIVFIKPKKPRAAAVAKPVPPAADPTPEVPVDTAASVDAVETEDVDAGAEPVELLPDDNEYTPEELAYYEQFRNYMLANAPDVDQLEVRLTVEDTLIFRKWYSWDLICSVLNEMQQEKGLREDFPSAYEAFLIFAEGAKKRMAQPENALTPSS